MTEGYWEKYEVYCWMCRGHGFTQDGECRRCRGAGNVIGKVDTSIPDRITGWRWRTTAEKD